MEIKDSQAFFHRKQSLQTKVEVYKIDSLPVTKDMHLEEFPRFTDENRLEYLNDGVHQILLYNLILAIHNLFHLTISHSIPHL